VIAPIVGVIASIESAEVLKILSGHQEAVSRRLTIVDLWDNQLRNVDLMRLQQKSDCTVCKQGKFVWLSGERGDTSAILCGRNSVQISALSSAALSLDQLAQRLAGIGRVQRNDFLLRLNVDAYVLSVFPDGRAIIGGTNDVATARSLYARYVGN